MGEAVEEGEDHVHQSGAGGRVGCGGVVVHAFAVEGTLFPVPVHLARRELSNQVVKHGDVVELPDPFCGGRPYLVALVRSKQQGQGQGQHDGISSSPPEESGDTQGMGSDLERLKALAIGDHAASDDAPTVVEGPISLQSKTMEDVHTYHRIHAFHPSLQSLPQDVFTQHVQPLQHTVPISPLASQASDILGPVR